MNASRRTAHTATAIAAKVVFVGAVIGGSAVGLASQASADRCDPLTLSMTPQPALSCPDPNAASPVDAAPAPDPAAAPVAGPLPDAFPPPGQPPAIPPVVGADGTQSYGQGGYLKDIWHEFHNGVPSDLIIGSPPPPADPAMPPAGPALAPPPGDPVLVPPTNP